MTMPFDGSVAGEALGMMQWDDDFRNRCDEEFSSSSVSREDFDAESAKILLPIIMTIFLVFFLGIAAL